jgi:chemotaxis protein MotB
MRRKKYPPHQNHERWLVSYADFITLLFAFFVVMFATSQADKGKAKQVAESVKSAFSEGQMKAVVAAILGGTVSDKGQGNAMMHGPGGAVKAAQEPSKNRDLVELMPSYKILAAELHVEIESGRIQVSMEPRGLTISFKQAALFPSGEDVIAPDALASIGTIAEAINKLPNPVRLEGHTDSMPIHTARFRNNWDLSAARSIALLELLTTNFHVPQDRLSIGGYADTAPVDSNDTEEGRARNRRVDIVILNQTGVMAEPGKRQ